jgi:putative CocE/NonD family hydrolase
VGGYYDQEDMFGSQIEYSTLEPNDRNHQNFLVLGPWKHGSWSSTSRHLGNLDFPEPVGKEFRAQIEAKFFAHYLKDAPGENPSGFDLEDTASYQTGSNTWKRYAHFPPKESRPTSLHLQGGGLLSWSGSTTQATTAYVSDPANPVPYRHRPSPGDLRRRLAVGQLAYGRPALCYRPQGRGRVEAACAQEDLVLTGEVVADIYAATTGTDCDLVVKLIDQYPGDDPEAKMRGYQLMTNAEIFRGRYLDSFEKPIALQVGSVREYKFSLHDVDHVFKAGHTVMVEVQSTWFPLYDRNPQTFVPNIMTAQPSAYQPATITVYSGPGHDSSLLVPVMNACEPGECF